MHYFCGHIYSFEISTANCSGSEPVRIRHNKWVDPAVPQVRFPESRAGQDIVVPNFLNCMKNSGKNRH